MIKTYQELLDEAAADLANNNSQEISAADVRNLCVNIIDTMFHMAVDESGSRQEGTDTIATGLSSHAEGSGSVASGNFSHAEGIHTTADGSGSHCEGYYSRASGAYSHAEASAFAYGEQSHAENTGRAYGMGSHAEGFNTIASGHGSHAEGYVCHALGFASHAEGGGSTFGTKAYGNYSHSEGFETIASGIASHAEGQSTLSRGAASHAEGTSTIASGISSHAEGNFTVASGDCSHAGGSLSCARFHGQYAHGAANNTQPGAMQYSRYYLYGTTDGIGTNKELYIGGESIRLAIDDGCTMMFNAMVVGRDTTTGESIGIRVVGVIKNVDGTVSLIDSPIIQDIWIDGSFPGYVFTVSADDTNKSLKFAAENSGGNQIAWHAVVEANELNTILLTVV